jgi:hypothetical protein
MIFASRKEALLELGKPLVAGRRVLKESVRAGATPRCPGICRAVEALS